MTPDGAARVVYRDTNGHIIELRLDGNWIATDLSAVT